MEEGNMEAGQGKARARAESVEGYAQRYVEDAHGLRLMALLDGMVRERDVRWAAEQLGVDARTLSTCLRRRRLTDHVRVTLERRLQSGSSRLAEQMGELSERVSALTGELDALRRAMAEQAGAVRELERRVAELESQRSVVQGAAPRVQRVVATASEQQGRPMRRRVRRETNPQIVTAEAEDGEEEVYRDAQPLVLAWREARAAIRVAQGRLDRAIAQERLMALEIALMEGHGLTLAPERDPFDGIKMHSELRWRRLELASARREQKRALRRRLLRRVLTFGLWWE